MKRALSLILAAGLVLAGVPGGAAVFGPNTVWGTVPQGASAAANAVLLDAPGSRVAMVPVIDGRFAFRDLPAGSYVVALQTPNGQEIARSFTVELGAGAEAEALFARDDVGAAVPPPAASAAAPASGRLGTTGWILAGAVAAGIATAIILISDDDEGNASESR